MTRASCTQKRGKQVSWFTGNVLRVNITYIQGQRKKKYKTSVRVQKDVKKRAVTRNKYTNCGVDRRDSNQRWLWSHVNCHTYHIYLLHRVRVLEEKHWKHLLTLSSPIQHQLLSNTQKKQHKSFLKKTKKEVLLP